MENTMNRLECKLKEIILESRDGHMTDYSRSLREDHLHGSAVGKNAFTVDDPASGTTIFMPWKLHKPLEYTFNSLATNSQLSHNVFKSFVDDFGLFPKFQNSRKKDDILDYILKKSNKNDDPLNFEEFLLALYLLAKYRASVMHTNEQYSFNNLLNMVLKNAPNQTNEHVQQDNLNLNLDALNNTNLPSRSNSKTLDGVIYHDSGLIIDTNIGKVYESPRKLGTKDFSNKLDNVAEPPARTVNNSGTFDADLVKKLLEVLKDQHLLYDSKDLQDRLEREVKMRNDLEFNYLQKLERLDNDKNQLNKELLGYNVKYNKLQVEFDTLENEYKNYKTQNEVQLNQYKTQNEQLNKDLQEANQQLEKQNYLNNRNQNTQKQLVLETEFEVKLFSIFCVYKDEDVVNGQFVMNEEQLITFCVDFGLGESETNQNKKEEPKAKQAYNKVYEYSYDGRLTYLLFKEFLMNLGLLLKPNYNPEEAFRYIVFQLVFSSSYGHYQDEPVEDYHPVYVTDDNNPWASNTNYANNNNNNNYMNQNNNQYQNNHYYQNQNNQNQNQNQCDQELDTLKFMDVEGKVWFNNQTQNTNVKNEDSKSTPRFN